MIPGKIRAGDTLDIPVTLTAYPAPDFALQLVLRGPAAIDLTAAADGPGPGHVFAAAAAVTADWQAGRYWWLLRATAGEEIFSVDEGQISVEPNLAALTGSFDGRTHAERVLEAIEAVIEGRASKDQESYTISGRSLQRTPIDDLMKLRTRYRAEVRQQRGGGLLGRAIKTRFTK